MSKLVRNLLLSFLTLTTVLLCILCGKIYRKNQVLEEKLRVRQSQEYRKPEEEPDDINIPYSKDASVVIADYFTWYYIFYGEENNNSGYVIERMKDDSYTITAGDLTVICDSKMNCTKSASLCFISNKHENLKNLNRFYNALSFFASLEYNNPLKLSDDEMGTVFEEVKTIYQIMIDAINKNQLSVENDTMVPFYDGKAGTYRFYSTAQGELIITVFAD